jgi:hypothetical protein
VIMSPAGWSNQRKDHGVPRWPGKTTGLCGEFSPRQSRHHWEAPWPCARPRTVIPPVAMIVPGDCAAAIDMLPAATKRAPEELR